MGSCPDSYDGRLCGSDNNPLQVWPCVREQELLKTKQAERLFIFRSTPAMDNDSATCSQTTLTASAMRMTEARFCDVMVVDTHYSRATLSDRQQRFKENHSEAETHVMIPPHPPSIALHILPTFQKKPCRSTRRKRKPTQSFSSRRWHR